jgi:hypothetical protein
MVVVSLFDKTGNMVAPWHAAGHDCWIVDSQHPSGVQHFGDRMHAVGCWLPDIPAEVPRPDVLFAFPPCTDLAVSGARWWDRKREKDPHFQEKAVTLARFAEEFSLGCPWMVENPVGHMSTAWRRPDIYFHPWQFTGHCENDNYTKKTGLWLGNGMRPPVPCPLPDLPPPDSRIHWAPPGPERANIRSATPAGFAQAMYLANKDCC